MSKDKVNRILEGENIQEVLSEAYRDWETRFDHLEIKRKGTLKVNKQGFLELFKDNAEVRDSDIENFFINHGARYCINKGGGTTTTFINWEDSDAITENIWWEIMLIHSDHGHIDGATIKGEQYWYFIY